MNEGDMFLVLMTVSLLFPSFLPSINTKLDSEVPNVEPNQVVFTYYLENGLS